MSPAIARSAMTASWPQLLPVESPELYCGRSNNCSQDHASPSPVALTMAPSGKQLPVNRAALVGLAERYRREEQRQVATPR